MTLAELAPAYEEAAALLRGRLRLLRGRLRRTDEPAERFALERRIDLLEQMLGEMNALSELTAHYYDRGYWRDERYTL